MIKHKISVRSEMKGKNSPQIRALIKKCVKATLDEEKILSPCLINVVLTDDEGIKKINLDFRKQDKPTDVLSFPMLDFSEGRELKPGPGDFDLETGAVILGDIVLSLQRAESQAIDYGNSFEAEIGFLTIHSVLHLLGYDHEEDSSLKKEMRKKEEALLRKLKLKRELGG